MKKITLLLLTLSFSICSVAQITIRGTVLSDSISLESASVIIKNTTKGIATNEKGQFQIEAKKGDTLSVSYLGYDTKDIVVDKIENLNIQLEVGNNLEEVVLKGYLDGRTIRCGTICRKTSCGVYCESSISTELINIIAPKLYPNPSTNGIFQLKLTEQYNEVRISVANISGQTIQNSTHQKFGEKLSIDLSQFSTGIYIINIIADGKRLEAIKAIRS